MRPDDRPQHNARCQISIFIGVQISPITNGLQRTRAVHDDYLPNAAIGVRKNIVVPADMLLPQSSKRERRSRVYITVIQACGSQVRRGRRKELGGSQQSPLFRHTAVRVCAPNISSALVLISVAHHTNDAKFYVKVSRRSTYVLPLHTFV